MKEGERERKEGRKEGREGGKKEGRKEGSIFPLGLVKHLDLNHGLSVQYVYLTAVSCFLFN
jgi:predicted transposase YdaD